MAIRPCLSQFSCFAECYVKFYRLHISLILGDFKLLDG